MSDDIPDLDRLATLTHECRRISDLLRSNDLTTPIEHLGRWKVRDVGAHLGGVHRWATRIVTTRSQAGPGFTKSKLTGVDLCDWFDAGVDELLEIFATNDPQGECPNFNPGSANTVGWWLRRQLHETTIHRWDIERACGATTPIGTVIAADGIDEYLDVFVRTRGKQTLTESLVLSSLSPAQTWTLVPAKKAARIDVVSGSVEESAATVSGSADQILLALWNRLALSETELDVMGDESTVASLFSL